MTASIVLLVLTLLYCSFLFWCLNGWKKKGSTLKKMNVKSHIVDVIIAIRNEEHTIKRLLELISDQSYGKSNYQIVVVDDHSTDQSAEIVNDFFRNHPQIKGVLLTADDTGKKSAMSQAIHFSNAELILTTDGDCLVGKNWIRTMIEPFSNQEISFVAGPVLLTGNNRLISLLQRMEMIGLTGIAGASVSNYRAMMCNGANLCFRKSAYDKVQGYSGSTFASGDDTQLMRKFQSENPKQIAFVKTRSALVKSHSQLSVSSFWQQRRRWATKIPFTLSFFTVFIAVISWLTHVGLLAGLILSWFYPEVALVFLLAVVMKIFTELFFLKKVASDLGQKTFTFVIILIQPLYWLYITFIGLAVPFATYEWKGRKMK